MTRAMELAPYNPSFLDMRNAILVADTSVFGGKQRAAIWKVFASRGMGFYAGSFGGNDTRPAADFHVPPASIETSTITGIVKKNGNPVSGATVRLAFQGAGAGNPLTKTDGTGHYTLTDIPLGTYLKLQASGAGIDDPAHLGHRRRRRCDGQLQPVTLRVRLTSVPSAAHASAMPAQTSSADTAPESTTSCTFARVTT